jgi:hypothetical protein
MIAAVLEIGLQLPQCPVTGIMYRTSRKEKLRDIARGFVELGLDRKDNRPRRYLAMNGLDDCGSATTNDL